MSYWEAAQKAVKRAAELEAKVAELETEATEAWQKARERGQEAAFIRAEAASLRQERDKYKTMYENLEREMRKWEQDAYRDGGGTS